MDKVLKIVTNSIFIILIAFLVIYFMLRILGIANIYKVQTGYME